MTTHSLAWQLTSIAGVLEQPDMNPARLKRIAETLRRLGSQVAECGLEPAPQRVGDVLERARPPR